MRLFVVESPQTDFSFIGFYVFIGDLPDDIERNIRPKEKRFRRSALVCDNGRLA